jgi:hypothetical protein
MNKQTQDLLRISGMCIFMLMCEYYPFGRRNASEARKNGKPTSLKK